MNAINNNYNWDIYNMGVEVSNGQAQILIECGLNADGTTECVPLRVLFGDQELGQELYNKVIMNIGSSIQENYKEHNNLIEFEALPKLMPEVFEGTYPLTMVRVDNFDNQFLHIKQCQDAQNGEIYAISKNDISSFVKPTTSTIFILLPDEENSNIQHVSEIEYHNIIHNNGTTEVLCNIRQNEHSFEIPNEDTEVVPFFILNHSEIYSSNYF